MKKGLVQQKMAVNSGAWVLFRYDPRLAAEGKNPLQIDSKAPSINVADYAYNETRYRMLLQQDEERAEELMKGARSRRQTPLVALLPDGGNGLLADGRDCGWSTSGTTNHRSCTIGRDQTNCSKARRNS